MSDEREVLVPSADVSTGRRDGDHRTLDDALRLPLATLSLAAGAIHFVVLGEHFEAYWAYGVFFLVAAWGQAVWALAAMRGLRRDLVLAGLVGNSLVVITWLVTRTLGVPLGPSAGETEPVAFMDALTTVFEVALAVGLTVVLVAPRSRGPRSSVMRAIAAASLLAIFGSTSWALATASGEGHEAAGEPHDMGEAAEGGSAHEFAIPSGGSLLVVAGGLEPGKTQLHVTVNDEDGVEVDIARLKVDARSDDGETNELAVTQLSQGHYVTEVIPPGSWTVTTAVKAAQGWEFAASFEETLQ